MSKKIIIANWKLNPINQKEAEKLLKQIIKDLKYKKSEIVFCPPIVYLNVLKKLSRKFKFGVQNIFYENTGSFTGEISSIMAKNLGAEYVILGHSERRALGEDDKFINKKVKQALDFGLIPIICIGEKERDAEHEYLNFIQKQINDSLNNISRLNISKIIIAYEPLWAIGKNSIREATGEEFREMRVFIKKTLNDKFGLEAMNKIKIIYGGSVNFKNVSDFIQIGESDGFLVGRDSLNAEKFIKIIQNVENAKY